MVQGIDFYHINIIHKFESSSWRDVFDTTLQHYVCQGLAAGRLFSPGTPISSTNKTNRHDITEILLKMAPNTINQWYRVHKAKGRNQTYNCSGETLVIHLGVNLATVRYWLWRRLSNKENTYDIHIIYNIIYIKHIIFQLFSFYWGSCYSIFSFLCNVL